MHEKDLIGQQVTNTRTGEIGTITKIEDGKLYVNFKGLITKYSYPSAFNSTLVLENKNLQEEMAAAGLETKFNTFRNEYHKAIEKEVDYLKKTGGNIYHAFDGVRLRVYGSRNIYTFETDTEFHFPDGTGITITNAREPITGYVISCEDYTITLESKRYLGEQVESIKFQTDQCMLLETLDERLEELDLPENKIAYEVACRGDSKIKKNTDISCGQEAAIQHALSKPITFIWGPPGTGKTYTLASIALKCIESGKRVLMLSYSNVSVDGALLQVARRSDYEPGKLLRYGYPRMDEVRNSETLTSYKYVLAKYPDLKSKYNSIIKERKQTDPKSEQYLKLTEQANKILDSLTEKEKDAIHRASFVATTASKTLVDKAIYNQRFDLVIFDEASMAYVPQIIFAAGLAEQSFVCLGDFRQLPAIVQSPDNEKLNIDIFQQTEINCAVDMDCGHEWLVMLTEQRRMHPDIAKTVSKDFYNERLTTEPKSIEENMQIAEISPVSGQAMALVDLSGMYSICIKNEDNSRANILSAFVCVRLAEKYCDKYKVAIITPYNAQSSLISAMLRDLQEQAPEYLNISCATVHQFQGSEESVVIYDAVDCYLMKYPGMLLTSLKDDTANRLFNVALTRAKGKFILVANKDYLERKHISKQLLFTKVMNQLTENDAVIQGTEISKELKSSRKNFGRVAFSNREQSWHQYIDDLSTAEHEIKIEIPGMVAHNYSSITELVQVLQEVEGNGIKVYIRKSQGAVIPDKISKFVKSTAYVTNPVTIIDKRIIWYGHPLAENDFISEGQTIKTKFFTTVRFDGTHTAKALRSLLGIR